MTARTPRVSWLAVKKIVLPEVPTCVQGDIWRGLFFFLSGKAWDYATEYALVYEPDPLGGSRPRAARRVRIRDVALPGATGKKEFLFLFKDGDEWNFGVKLVGISPDLESGARYPRVVARQSEASLQNPDLTYAPDDDDKIDGT